MEVVEEEVEEEEVEVEEEEVEEQRWSLLDVVFICIFRYWCVVCVCADVFTILSLSVCVW